MIWGKERKDGLTAIESEGDHIAFKFNLYLKDGYIPCIYYASKKRFRNERRSKP